MIVRRPLSQPHSLYRLSLHAPVRQYRRSHVAYSGWTDTLLFQSEVIGRGLILFVLFASTMNWWHYKELREKMEEKEKEKDKTKNKK